MQSRYYDPNICRFINADGYVSTGQGILGNNMFAYCLNNPVAHTDAAGSAAKTCLTADGAIDDTPWWDHSPGGGGFVYYCANITTQYDGDKFYTQIAFRYIVDGLEWLYDVYLQEYLRQQEMELQLLLAQQRMFEYAYAYVTADEFWSTDIGIVAQSTIVSAGVGAVGGFYKSIPVALAELPVSPLAALGTIASGTLGGLASGAVGGLVTGIVTIIFW